MHIPPPSGHNIPQSVPGSDDTTAIDTRIAAPDSLRSRTIEQQLSTVLQDKGRQPVDTLPLPDVNAGSVATTKAGLDALTPAQVSTDIHALMALFQKCAQEMRTSARESATAAGQAEAQALFSAAEKIREAATQRMIGAIIGGSAQILGGLGKMGSAGFAAAKMGGATTNAQVSRLNHIAGAGDGASGIMGGAGAIAQGIFERTASEKDAERAKLEAEAQVLRNQAEGEKELANQMLEVIRDTRSRMDSIEQSRAATNRDIARNI